MSGNGKPPLNAVPRLANPAGEKEEVEVEAEARATGKSNYNAEYCTHKPCAEELSPLGPPATRPVSASFESLLPTILPTTPHHSHSTATAAAALWAMQPAPLF